MTERIYTYTNLLKNIDLTRRPTKKVLLDVTSVKDLKIKKKNKEQLSKTESLHHLLTLTKNILKSHCGNFLSNKETTNSRSMLIK